MHRVLPPSAIAGVSVVCALGPWVFSEAMALRALAAAAAATAVVGAVVMRRWDTQAGKQVAELTRARAGDEWRYEERVAELETDLEESRELRAKLEQRLRARRAELAGLRNEHAALLRRYATAETERATALEGRRLLEIEAAVPSSALALPPAHRAEPEPAEAGTDFGDDSSARAVFSPEGVRLYRKALTALARFDGEAAAESVPEPTKETAQETAAESDEAVALEAAALEAEVSEDTAPGPVAVEDDADEAKPGAHVVLTGKADVRRSGEGETDSAAKPEGVAEAAGNVTAEDAGEAAAVGVTAAAGASRSEAGAPAAQEDEAQGKPVAADGHARAAATSTAPAESAQHAGRPAAGHFTVPTAVAVVPAAPARRPVVEGGFDFFGTQKSAPHTALDSVQNEDLADVVGPEALAVHKAEAEAEFKPAGPPEGGAGQVIDLTAHDETEQIDVQGLRSAAS
ncbi:hypothetical protein GCM10010339_50770 [Streptomyces alanosinicus]|uniref:Secreted protein n=1 Tax=Streptomyces alanosinicus TaxID=68171 RepID=A0A918YKF5_9ACTN|nr:hypothetical protein GCM10010339_50770 [Streptomyces alanosinicus]